MLYVWNVIQITGVKKVQRQIISVTSRRVSNIIYQSPLSTNQPGTRSVPFNSYRSHHFIHNSNNSFTKQLNPRNSHHMMLKRTLIRTFWATSPLLLSFHGTYAVPFRTTRGGSTSESILEGTLEDGDNNTLAMDAIVDTANGHDGEIIRISKHIPTLMNVRRSPIVEEYYNNLLGGKVGQSNTSNKPSYDTTELSDISIKLLDEIKSNAINLTDFLIATRRTLHQYPELMYQEQFTSQTVQGLLRSMNVSYTTGWAKNLHPNVYPGPGGYGIVADIGTGNPNQPCVLLRADMDALPIHELTEMIETFKSRNPNKMHACGHDAHTTMLLGAVSILKRVEDSIPGTIRIMFQPAEEGGAGAKRMIEEGILEQIPKPQYAFGMHVWPVLPSGTIATRPGPLMAACERFEILIAGVGGHAAMPHLTIDPVVAASSIVMNLQTIVSRTISPLEAGVCSITQIDTGTGAFNVIPHSAIMKGTIRSLSTETLLQLRDKVQHIVETTAAVHGCNVTITYSPDYYPVTVNDPKLYDTFSKHVGNLLSDDGILHEVEPTMGAEDFSFLAEKIPSTFFFIGQGSGTNPPTNYGLHHPHFALDERVLTKGVELHVNLALRSIGQLLYASENNNQSTSTSMQ